MRWESPVKYPAKHQTIFAIVNEPMVSKDPTPSINNSATF